MRRGYQEAGDRPRRFYKTVSVSEAEDGHAILLDERQVRGPRGGRLVTPTRALADLIAEEWAGQGETLDVAGMHATRLANTAIDSIPQAREATAQSVADYASSDLLCYFAQEPEALVHRQTAHWEPVLQRAEGELGLQFVRAAGIIHCPQPEATLTKVRDLARSLDDFHLAGVAFGASLYGSGVLALALQRGWLDGAQALSLSRLDEIFQEEAWGVDEEAAERVARLSVESAMLDAWFRALDAG
ncbi:ATP12 family chaperone protein [Phenylobacterium sp.]|uniref:ATP12 family chaperone protein n=1 Tax=Phenylobacterium sp. TaxID=1871053 RepID=UPI00272F7172|nr:ATP12 family protein [Phenylobacterium sp.]MDP1874046.1 ATP12 family protein [Phenylobacterium sp.]